MVLTRSGSRVVVKAVTDLLKLFPELRKLLVAMMASLDGNVD